MEKLIESQSTHSYQEDPQTEQCSQVTESFDLSEIGVDFPPPSEAESAGASIDARSNEALDLPPDSIMPSPYEAPTELSPLAGINNEAALQISPATRLTFNIEGMEASQATQFYKSSRHLHAPHAESDNAVPLIGRKHLAIRVYPNFVNTWLLAQSPASGLQAVPINIFGSAPVYGDVWFKRIDVADTYKQATKLNSSVTGRRATTIDRGNKNHTLNFRISDLYTRGKLIVYSRCRAYVSGQWRYTPWFGRVLTFKTVPSVRIRAHGVHYHRNGIIKEAPPLSDFIATGVYLRKTYPMSRFHFLSYDVIHFSGDLTNTSGGGCGQGWNALWDQLRTLYNASGQDANHYALMKKGIPTAYGGCGGGNVGASFVGDGSVMAQELGHGLGRAHAPGCGAGGPDPSYPGYTHPKTATIGEYGMDYATGKIYDPANSNDFMGYCGNPWVSPYTYRALIAGINDQPSAAPANISANAHVENLRYQQEHLYLNFRVSCNGNVDLQNGFSLVGSSSSENTNGSPTDHSIELRDGDDNVLWAKRLYLEEAHQDHDDSHTQYSEAIPMFEGAARLAFKCGHADGATIIEIPKAAPTVKIKPLKINTCEAQSGSIKLDWNAQCGNSEQVTAIIRYTNDGGETWRPIAVGLTECQYMVDLDQLPGGKDCRLQVMASNMLRTATDETTSFTVNKTPRQAMISPVQQSDEARNSGVIELAGCAYSPDGCADEHDCVWNSSLDGALGSGEYLIANNLTPGEHVISLTAPNGVGGKTREEYTIYVPLRT